MTRDLTQTVVILPSERAVRIDGETRQIGALGTPRRPSADSARRYAPRLLCLFEAPQHEAPPLGVARGVTGKLEI
jgi:hypothetical protein